MPAPLDPEKREAIEQDIRAGLKRNEIARTHQVSGSTVSKIGKDLERQGSGPAFDRSQTKRARELRAEDVALNRADLALKLLQDAFDLRERMWLPQKAVFAVAVKGGGQRLEIMERDTEAAEFKNYMTAVGIAVDKIRVLTEQADSTAQAVSLLERLMEHVDAQ